MQSPVTPSLSQMTISHGVTFNVLKRLFLVSEWTAKNKRMWENHAYGKVIYFELFGENCMEIIITRRFFFQITNYQGF
jgi:hypothetical protein